jgi:DNA-binding Xre family transcriptional regulator
MPRNRADRKTSRTAKQIARDRALRERFQSERPSLEALVASGEYSEPLAHGEFLSLMEFAGAIRTIRKRLGMSLSEVSEASGIDKAALSRLETGQIENPTYGTLERVANALGKRLRLALEDKSLST